MGRAPPASNERSPVGTLMCDDPTSPGPRGMRPGGFAGTRGSRVNKPPACAPHRDPQGVGWQTQKDRTGSREFGTVLTRPVERQTHVFRRGHLQSRPFICDRAAEAGRFPPQLWQYPWSNDRLLKANVEKISCHRFMGRLAVRACGRGPGHAHDPRDSEWGSEPVRIFADSPNYLGHPGQEQLDSANGSAGSLGGLHSGQREQQ